MRNDRKIIICGFADTIHAFISLMYRPAHLRGSPLPFGFEPLGTFIQVLYNQGRVYIVKLVLTISFSHMSARPHIKPCIPGRHGMNVVVVEAPSVFARLAENKKMLALQGVAEIVGQWVVRRHR